MSLFKNPVQIQQTTQPFMISHQLSAPVRHVAITRQQNPGRNALMTD
jgi:hypothetical protein